MSINKSFDALGILEAIRNNDVLKYTTVCSDEKWVSDVLREKLDTWLDPTPFKLHPPVLISAPTGSGKTTFVLKYLADYAKNNGQYILFLSNRSLQNLQQKMYGLRRTPMPASGMMTLADTAVIGNIIFSTYAGFDNCIYTCKDYIQYVKAIIIDEAHFFYSDSAFNASTYSIFYKILYMLPQSCIRIYLTATPKNVKPLIAYMEKRFLENYYIAKGSNPQLRKKQSDNINNTTITEYVFTPDFSGIDLKFFHSFDTIELIIKQSNSNEKWLVFVRTIDDGKRLRDKFTARECDFISSDIKEYYKEAVHKIVRAESFSKKLLICTSTLDSGFNFHDPLLKNIVIDSYDCTQVMQMLGRKRRDTNERINVFIRVPDYDTVRSHLKFSNDCYNILKEYDNHPDNFIIKQWNNNRISDMENLFYVNSVRLQSFIKAHPGSLSFYGIPEHSVENVLQFLPNPFAAYYFSIYSGICEKIETKLDKVDSQSFEEYVSSWFNIQFSESMFLDNNPKKSSYSSFMELFKKYIDLPSLQKDQMDEFAESIIALTDTFDGLYLKKTVKMKNVGSKALINNCFKELSIPYSLHKTNNEYILKPI